MPIRAHRLFSIIGQVLYLPDERTFIRADLGGEPQLHH